MTDPQQHPDRPGDKTDLDDRPRVSDVSGDSPEDRRVQQMLEHTIDVGALAVVMNRQAAADAADALEDLEDREATEVLEEMDDDAAAQALAEMQTPLAAVVIQDLLQEDPPKAGKLLGLMAPDDATDLLQAVPQETGADLLALMEEGQAAEVVQLAAYDSESAGGMMTTAALVLRDAMTVQQAIDYIRSTDAPAETQVAFVTNSQDQLVGVVGLRHLLLARKAERIEELMSDEIRAIRPELDREDVARTFDRYDFSVLPVVNEHDRLLGVVTVDDVIDIIREEQTEDVQKIVGAGGGEAVYSSLKDKIRGRLPWLTISLAMTCLAAFVILVGEEVVQKYWLLTFLLPVIAALVGNAGHQALAVTIRGIVLDEVRRDRIWPLLVREGAVGLINGVTIGIVLFLFVLLISAFKETATPSIGVVAGVATATSMTVGTLAGSGVPLLMRRFGFDPAQSSAIFLIMITDFLAFSTLILLTAATL